MHLYDVPLIFALLGLALYAVLAGASFGGSGHSPTVQLVT
jgi:hypothetical protein